MALATTWNAGRTLHMARRDARLTQKQVADHLGVSRPLVSKWERNKAAPDINQWRALVLLFEERGVPTSVLLSLTWNYATAVPEIRAVA